MDWLEFIQKSEWPLVVGGGLLLFRKPIAELLRGIRPKKFKGFGFDAEFETSLQKAEVLTAETNSAADVPLPPARADAAPENAHDEGPPPQSSEPTKPDASLAPSPSEPQASHLMPQARVLRAYSALEARLRSYVRALRPHMLVYSNRVHIGEIGRLIGFDDGEVSALIELRKLRDALVHDSSYPVSEMEAVRFELVASKLGFRGSQLYRESVRLEERVANALSQHNPGQS